MAAVEYDISRGKTINQSSIVSGFEPSKYATDGNLNTYFKAYNGFDGVWVQIDLNAIFNISKVILWTTDDTEFYLARNIRLFAKTRNNYKWDTAVELTRCEYTNGGTASYPSRASQIKCTVAITPIFGRYVLIDKPGIETLYLAESVVLTGATIMQIITIANISQNHNFENIEIYSASKAIDGDVNTCSFTAQESTFLRNITGWLKIDLGNNFNLYNTIIYDTNSHNAFVSGFFSIYVELDESSLTNLCFNFNKFSNLDLKLYEINCISPIVGRYVTFIKNKSANRADALFFCEIQIFALHSENIFNYPINYTTTMLITISSPTILSSTTASIFTSFYNSSKLCETNNEYELQIEKLEREKIIIGIVVSIFASIVGMVVGGIIGQHINKKKEAQINTKLENVNPYERTNTTVEETRVYSELFKI